MMGESRKVERNATLVCGPLPLVVPPTAPRDTPAFAPVNRVGGGGPLYCSILYEWIHSEPI